MLVDALGSGQRRAEAVAPRLKDPPVPSDPSGSCCSIRDAERPLESPCRTASPMAIVEVKIET